jgi:hypothetical protein
MRILRLSIAASALVAACAGAAPAPRVELVGGLAVTPAAAWIARAPASAMRAAEYTVPGPGGDASLVVYHFGRGGGSVADNFARWSGQFEAPGGGAAVPDVLEHGERARAGGLVAHELRISGRYVAEVTPGSDERHDEPGWRMLAAVVETPAGAYYPKLVGPEATVRANEAAWDAYLDTLGFAAP